MSPRCGSGDTEDDDNGGVVVVVDDDVADENDSGRRCDCSWNSVDPNSTVVSCNGINTLTAYGGKRSRPTAR
jgi:hypothetical protein